MSIPDADFFLVFIFSSAVLCSADSAWLPVCAIALFLILSTRSREWGTIRDETENGESNWISGVSCDRKEYVVTITNVSSAAILVFIDDPESCLRMMILAGETRQISSRVWPRFLATGIESVGPEYPVPETSDIVIDVVKPRNFHLTTSITIKQR